MRLIISVIVAAGIAAGATYALLRSQADQKLAAAISSREAAWQAERSGLEAELERARGKQPQVRTVFSTNTIEGAVSGLLSPEEIILRLKTMRATSRDKSIRKVVHHLEMLADLGPQAIPAIKAYIEEYQDVDYFARAENGAEEGQENRPQGREGREGREGRGPGGDRDRDPRERLRGMFNRGDVRLTFTTPPSLRIGLVDVLAQIGGPEAEEVLSNMLAESGRAMEVAHVSKTLKEITGEKHRDVAVNSAKDLLMNPMQAQPGDRLDQNSKDYLYYVLTLFNDSTFIPVAQQMLVGADGRVDMVALGYLNSTLKENAMPAIASAFSDARITNQLDKAPLMQMALNYVGKNAQANEMLNTVVANEEVPGEMRAMTVLALLRDDAPKETLEARLPVIEALKGSTQDERVQRSLQVAERNLQRKIAGEEVEENPMRAIFREGGRGQGGAGGRGGERGGRTPRTQ